MLAVFFVTVLALLSIFQIALAAGVPWGRLTWGGQYKGVLPTKLRIAAALSVVVYGVMGLFALSKAGVAEIISHQTTVDIGMWVVAAYLILSIVPNAISKSKSERYVTTPLSIVLAVLALAMAL